MNNDIEVRALLREFGFELEDFPQYLRSNFTLIEYARKFPPDLRPQYLGGLLQCFGPMSYSACGSAAGCSNSSNLSCRRSSPAREWDH